MPEDFADHFGPVAEHYASSRPGYPAEVFAWLAGRCAGHDLAWDCGAGSGQASHALARHFARVLATDASEAQIARAAAHPRIEFRVAPETDSGLADRAADLVLVAQALHWFDLARFYPEVQRVLKPGALFAALTYGLHSIDGAEIDATVADFYARELGPYWPPQRRLVENAYRDLPFPFARLAVPPFTLRAHWTLRQLLGYLRSWSATARYLEARGSDPVAGLARQLRPLWGDEERLQTVEWPLTIVAGHAPG